jgi:hypothetical protein
MVQTAQMAQAQMMIQRQAPVMAATAATQGAVARIAQQHGPQDPSQPQASGDSPSPDSEAA